MEAPERKAVKKMAAEKKAAQRKASKRISLFQPNAAYSRRLGAMRYHPRGDFNRVGNEEHLPILDYLM